MSLELAATLVDTAAPPAAEVPAAPRTVRSRLVADLAAALRASGIRYCQWKGHTKEARWGAGEGDIDLLVDRTALDRFAALVAGLGFREAHAAPRRQVPGVTSWLGLDASLGRLIHLHVHTRLVVGRADGRHYLLPIERAVLDGARDTAWFRAPAPPLAWALVVLQQVLKLDLLALPGTVRERLALLQPQLAELRREAGSGAVETVATLLPDLGGEGFELCVAALEPGATWRQRAMAKLTLAKRLRSCARGGGAGAMLGRLGRRLARAIGPNSVEDGKGLATGGAIIALLGADGAGKSTAARMLRRWLGTELRTCHAHLGRPPRTVPTYLAGLLLKLGRRVLPVLGKRRSVTAIAHLELLRHLCTGRDRYVLYHRMRRFAAAGGIAICERYPLKENVSLAGPSKQQGLALDAQTRFARGLRRVEQWYYDRITAPDCVIVLRVEPEIAVARKTDEPSDYVRARARRMWTIDWTTCGAIVVDAGRDVETVHADLRRTVWDTL